MITNKEGTKELMINMKTGERFMRDLMKEEIANIILGGDMEDEEKLNLLEQRGFSLLEIFEMALNFRD